jgi:hypothetical protein
VRGATHPPNHTSGFSRDLGKFCHFDQREKSPEGWEISPFGRDDTGCFAAEAASTINLAVLIEKRDSFSVESGRLAF